MKRSLIVFRHGETLYNRDKIFCGWINAWLNKKGEEQAKVLAKKLKKESIDYGFCSDMLRSKQTLAHVLKNHRNAKVIADQRIKERNYGIFTGHSKKIFEHLFPDKYREIHRGYHAYIPKGENFYEVSCRVFPFMNELFFFMQEEKADVCISAHANSMRSIVEYLESLSPEEVEGLEFSPTQYKKYKISFGK